MKMYIKLILSSFIFYLLSSCVSLETRTLAPVDNEKYTGKTLTSLFDGGEENSAPAPSGKIVLGDFTGGINMWWGCNDAEVSHAGSVLKAEFEEARWRCVGHHFDAMDFSETQVLRIRMKAESSVFKGEAIKFLIRFEDVNGEETNYQETHTDLKVGGDYADYYVDFTDKMRSAYGPFDATAVKKMKIFFNTKGADLFTGAVYIDKVELIGQKP